MRSGTLGATGLAVTPIGLGLAALGRPAYINLGRDEDFGVERSVETMERRCHEVSTPPSRLGSATWTPHARTAWPRRSSPPG